MGEALRFEEILLKLALFDEGLVEEMSGRGLTGQSALDSRTVALLQIAVSVATGSSQVCLQWSTARALAAGASKDEVADVLLAIAPVAGLDRVVSAAPGVASALDYDIEAAMEAPDGY
jgi:AhpD family alkylhydroperoxidase